MFAISRWPGDTRSTNKELTGGSTTGVGIPHSTERGSTRPRLGIARRPADRGGIQQNRHGVRFYQAYDLLHEELGANHVDEEGDKARERKVHGTRLPRGHMAVREDAEGIGKDVNEEGGEVDAGSDCGIPAVTPLMIYGKL